MLRLLRPWQLWAKSKYYKPRRTPKILYQRVGTGTPKTVTRVGNTLYPFHPMQDPSNLFPAVEETMEILDAPQPETTNGNGHGHELTKLRTPVDVEINVTDRPTIIPTPIFPPLELAKKVSSGRYVGTSGSFRLELRVDVDGKRPCRLISGDFYSISGGVTTYFGSFKSGAVTLVWTSTSVTITGTITPTWSTAYNKFRITIPRVSIITSGNPAATITFLNAANSPGSTYTCTYNSPYFRTIQLEIDYETGATIFDSYDTNSLAHGGVGRVLNTITSYAEAGIQLVRNANTNVIPVSDAGGDAVWTNAELEAAMHRHFSIVRDAPVWQTYLMACKSRHQNTSGGSTLFGIMFDYSGSYQRQGCAVFQTQVNNYYGGAGTHDANRHMLYCYVHELGHSFNLLHSWDKGRSNSLSWMNYDWRYDQANGSGSFWLNFAFQFDDGELVHMRHDNRNSVIMGGDGWNVNAGAEAPPSIDVMQPIIENHSGLNFTIKAKDTYYLGEPVVVELALRLRDLNGKEVHTSLNPNLEQTKVAIRKPNGQVVMYEGLADHFALPGTAVLTEENPSIYASTYIGFGRDGFYFDQPGFYSIKAAYRTIEGGVITSPDIKIRVKHPVTETEDAIAALYMGDQAGRLFYLLGSDGDHLEEGNEALRTVIEKYPKHPLSSYAALALGVNASRDFKTVNADKTVTVRPSDPLTAGQMISKVFEDTRKGEGVDNITLNYAMRRKAAAELKSGATDTAKDTLDTMRNYFEKQNLKPHVMDRVEEQIASTLASPE
jgi:hypothetical protein